MVKPLEIYIIIILMNPIKLEFNRRIIESYLVKDFIILLFLVYLHVVILNRCVDALVKPFGEFITCVMVNIEENDTRKILIEYLSFFMLWCHMELVSPGTCWDNLPGRTRTYLEKHTIAYA